MRRLVTGLSMALLLTLGATSLYAKPEHISEQKIRKLDRTLTTHKAQRRHFKTKEEFRRTLKRSHAKKTHPKHAKAEPRMRQYAKSKHLARKNAYHPGYAYDEERYFEWYDPRPLPHSRAYRHPRRGWILAYRYDRAAFYDQDGFYYGYFNRYGYYFEGVFYRYDRNYTYRDRVRGRGLFDRYYYRPADFRYYGFGR